MTPAQRAVAWVVGAAVALILLAIAGKCYGDSRAQDAMAKQRDRVADSIATLSAAHYRAVDSAARVAAANANAYALAQAKLAAKAKADAAHQRARADSVLAAAASLNPDSLPPKVRQVFANLEMSLKGVLQSNEQLAASNDSLILANEKWKHAADSLQTALDTAKVTIARKDTAIATCHALKTPHHSFLYHMGIIARDAGVLVGTALTGLVVGRAI